MKRYERVIVIGVDGAGAFFKDADTPCFDRIFEKGAVTYSAITENPSISAECWGSMLLGVDCKRHGLTNDIISHNPYPCDSELPTVFRLIREREPEASLCAFSHWNPINSGIIEDGIGVYKEGGIGSSELTDRLLKHFGETAPRLTFLHINDPDSAGHKHGYKTKEQLESITYADGLIGRIYDFCRDLGVIDETLFVVLSDHGGYVKEHGGWTEDEKYITIAIAGRTVRNMEPSNLRIRDIGAIVLTALGLADAIPSFWDSRVPDTLFEQ